MATIDERLEALAHSVELLAGMHRETETQIIKTQKVVMQLAEAMTRLSRIVETHENRITKLEDE
jgi:hypothetical protein